MTASASRSPLRLALALASLLALLPLAAPEAGSAAAPPTRFVYGKAEIVPIPASIPHEAGDMVDRRIVPNLRWIAQRFPIYVTDGYSGRLPNGGRAGCRGCHVRNSDHHNGLAVDIVPLNGGPRCDRRWRPITRLARWAEPRQNRPRPPFRWVGYDGDANHGCGHHLHLSWEHAPTPSFRLARWVRVFAVSFRGFPRRPQPMTPQRPSAPQPPPAPQPEPPPPTGGVSSVETGGLSSRGR